MPSSPFIDIKEKPLFKDQAKINGSAYLKDLRKLSVGVGGQVVRADRSGWWAGANKFEDAPFRVDMQGRVYVESDDGTIVIDNINNRIVFYDDTGTPYGLIGYQENGF